MINTCLMIRSCEKGSSRMYKDSLIFKIRGLKVKGGKINRVSGMLEVEKDREFSHDLGSLQLEFTQFDEKDSIRFLVILLIYFKKKLFKELFNYFFNFLLK